MDDLSQRVASLVGWLARDEGDHGRIVSELESLREKGADVSAAAAPLEDWLDRSPPPPHPGHSVTVLCRILTAECAWPRLVALGVHPRVEIRLAALYSLAAACTKEPAAFAALVPAFVSALVDRDARCRHRGTSILESYVKVDGDDLARAEATRRSEGECRCIWRTLDHIAAIRACDVCRDLRDEVATNVDDGAYPPAQRLMTIVWTGGFMGGVGFSACDKCGNIYYREREYSFTGSQSHDYERFIRLDRFERALVAPLLEAREQAPGELVVLAKQLCSKGFASMDGRAGLALALTSTLAERPPGSVRAKLEERLAALKDAGPVAFDAAVDADAETL